MSRGRTEVKLVFNNVPAVMRLLIREEDNLAQSFAHGVRNKAKLQVPVRTGALKLSIRVNSEGHAHYTITASSKEGGAPRAYAQYVEYGTRYHHAQPYMRPAYAEAKVTTLPAIAAGLRLRINLAATRGI